MGSIYNPKKAKKQKQENNQPHEQQEREVFYSTDKGVTGDKPQNIKDKQRGKVFGNPSSTFGN